MPPVKHRSRNKSSRAGYSRSGGFTVLELLVVIGIILVLMGLLLPAVSKARLAAYDTNTQAEIAQIRSAIENYYSDFQSYPGPFSNQQIIGGTATCTNVQGYGTNSTAKNVTMSENLVLGLLGGLSPTGTGGAVVYTSSNVGRGPTNLVSSNLNQMNPYLSQSVGSSLLSNGNFTDSGGKSANDTNIPEFIDRFPDPLPILYLRSKAGAYGIVSPDASGNSGVIFQYDVRMMTPYTSVALGTGFGGAIKAHGLQTVASDGTVIALTNYNPANATSALDAYSYLRDQTLNTSGNYITVTPPTSSNISADGNSDGVPRQHDGYILISAGKDRIYGTLDDRTNFGDVHP